MRRKQFRFGIIVLAIFASACLCAQQINFHSHALVTRSTISTGWLAGTLPDFQESYSQAGALSSVAPSHTGSSFHHPQKPSPDSYADAYRDLSKRSAPRSEDPVEEAPAQKAHTSGTPVQEKKDGLPVPTRVFTHRHVMPARCVPIADMYANHSTVFSTLREPSKWAILGIGVLALFRRRARYR